MRLSEILAEDVEADANRHALATDLQHKVIRHFMKTELADVFWHGRGMDAGNGRIIVLFEGRILGWPEPYQDAMFGIEGTKTSWDPSGYHTRFKSGKQLCVVKCTLNPVEDLAEAAHIIIHSMRVHEVMLHEFIHMIDDVEGRISHDGDEKYQASKGTADYWNHPVEFNAYFHQVGDRLLSFINFAKENPSPRAILGRAKAHGITADFWATWKRSLKDIGSQQVREFLTQLRQRNNQRALSRYYKLHQEALEYIKWAEAASRENAAK